MSAEFAAVVFLAAAAGASAMRGVELLRRRRAVAPEPEEPVTLVRIRNPDAFRPVLSSDAPEVAAMKEQIRDLFERAFSNPEHADAHEALDWCAERAADPECAIFAARSGSGSTWNGLAIVGAWCHAFSPHPWVLHNYAPGARAVRIALSRAMAEWVRERGHVYVSAINRSGFSDERWIAAHRRAGSVHALTSYAEFNVGA